MDGIEKIKRLSVRFERFVRFVIVHFIDDDCAYRASALAFTSLLAIVPLMTVGLAVLSSFPVFHDLTQPIQDFIFGNFVPTTGKIVQNYLQQFTIQVSKLSIWGVVVLFITAILVMVTIERAMNTIWRVSNSRHGIAAFLLYWAILSLAPVFLGLSLAVTSYIISMPFLNSPQTPSSILVNTLPFLLSLIGFTFLYFVVPNCSVKFKHSLIGGIFAALLFELAKQGFAFYLHGYDSYQLLYGAFATVPIFFVWVYWVWIIILVGAEVSYALSVHHQRRCGIALDGFSHALIWLYYLWQKQKEGQGATLNELIDMVEQPFAIDINHMINQLKHLHLIHTSEAGYFLLSRDLGDISLYWLSHVLPYHLPSYYQLQQYDLQLMQPWQKAFKKHEKLLERALDIDLAYFFNLSKETDNNETMNISPV
jgi:membrane protein